MRALVLAVAMLPLFAGCGPSLYESRMPLAPLLDKLHAAGGAPALVLHPRTLADLAPLESGRRYEFDLLVDGTLAVAPVPVSAASNEYRHPVLAGGGRVRSAGGLRVEREGGELVRVIVDQDSRAYCPSLRSLDAVVATLESIGVRRAFVQREDRPPRCASKRHAGGATMGALR